MFTQVCVLTGAVKLAVFPLRVMIGYLVEQLRGKFSVLQCRLSFKNLTVKLRASVSINVLGTCIQIALFKTEVFCKKVRLLQ